MGNGNTKIAIVTGPTGGHFFPGLAIGEELGEKGNISVSFLIPNRKYLIMWLKKKEFQYRIIPEVRINFRNIFLMVRFAYIFLRCVLLLSREKFDLLVITGSYVTLPFLLAGRLLNIKTFVHEQNLLPGRVTRFSSLIADRIALSFPSFCNLPRRKTVVTGFPIIKDFRKKSCVDEIRREFGFSAHARTILVLGGSQGATFLNMLIEKNLDYLSKKNLQFLHLAGKDKEKLTQAYEKHKVRAVVFDFCYDMAKLYSITDIAICRGGGGTLAEISEWKIPSLVVPYPHAGAHQRYNALYFAERGACNILEQGPDAIRDFRVSFEKTLKDVHIIKRNLEENSISDSTGNTVEQIMELLGNGKRHS